MILSWNIYFRLLKNQKLSDRVEGLDCWSQKNSTPASILSQVSFTQTAHHSVTSVVEFCGREFSKKISKIEIIFLFDFHKCSHRQSKVRRHFRNKSRSILKLTKNKFYKKCGPKLIFFNEKKSERFEWFLTWKIDFESQI